jgi:hypothetical protein
MHIRSPGSVFLDDTEGFLVVGGLEGVPAFRGYVGQAIYYRNRNISPNKVSWSYFIYNGIQCISEY